MEAPTVGRHRRPFLLPVWLSFAAAVLLVALALTVVLMVYRSDTTTVVVLAHHAEQEPGSIQDPPLSAEGEQRAQHLAQMFGRSKGVGHLDAVYVTDARRSQQTAGPLAERLGKQVVVVPATNPKATAALVLREHDGGTVLVVSQSTAVPALIRELSGIDVSPIADDEYDTIYVVSIPTFGHSSVLRMEY